MRTFDLSPFLHSAVGFDNLFDFGNPSETGERALGSFGSKAQNFPPYNIEKIDEDAYLITMALAGFSEEDLTVTVEDDTLIIEGKAVEESDAAEKNYLHKGIAKRAFERQFQLADSIKVVNANFENGLLHVGLKREIPEHKKPRKVTISKGKNKLLN